MRLTSDDLNGWTTVEVVRGETPVDRGRQAKQEPCFRRGGQHLRRCVPHRRQKANDLLVPTPGQEPDHGGSVLDPEPASRLFARRRRL